MTDPTRRFTDQVAIVTGGAGGLGKAIALALADEGCHLALFDTNAQSLTDAVVQIRESGVNALGLVVDVRDRTAVDEAIGQVIATLGGVDILIATAGGSLGTPREIDEISAADLDLVIDVNIKGTFNVAAAVLASMKARGGGAIVTFSSIGGRSTSPVTGVPYAAAKAGLLGLTRRLAREVGGDNIRVNAIAPGLFLTGRLQAMFDELSQHDRDEVLDGIPLRRMPEIRECVEPVLFLASQASSYITGAVLDVNGGRFMAG